MSARVVYQDGRPIAVSSVHSDPAMVAAEGEILAIFRRRYPNHRPWTGPVMLRFTAVFEIPAGWNRALTAAADAGRIYHTSVPDKDNIEKLIVDALNGFAFVDDSQIQGGGVKRYGSPPRLDVELQLLTQPDLPLTPANKTAEARVVAGKIGKAPKRRKSIPAKAGTPSPLQARIDAALARDKAGGR